jgi:hypothetical protein
MVGAKMDGIEKNKLLVIRKSKNPRAMKNTQKKSLPVTYENNKKARMISDVFRRWLLDFEKKLLSGGRKVLIFLDNCSGKELTFILKKKLI